ncbi:MAG TPA: DUF3971 domain-containing protein [Xanthobacteraceae bacterium]|nr:DUF3971 domain-containing protein [Xanthobacteraceae bacterium]
MLDTIGQTLFRTRYGNLSRAKIVSIGVVASGLIYILLVRGFFPFDVASPWIASALERQLGPGHRVEIGSTRLDHDATGAPVLRVEGIRVFGPGGKVIANAPSAEVGLDGSSLLVGNFRARRIDLVGAETLVQVGSDGRVAIRAGRDATPITASESGVTTEANTAQAASRSSGQSKPVGQRPPPFHYPELVRWLDSFEKGGLDGVALSQIGLKQGSLTVEDADTGRQWSFRDINIQLSRPPEGGLLFSLSSSGEADKWSLTATVAPPQDGVRAIDIVASNLAPRDIMLAAGVANADFLAENALSGILRAQVAADGKLVSATFRASAGGGIVGSASDPDARFRVDTVQIQARFDAERQATVIEPLVIQASGNRLVLTAVIEAPKDGTRNWPVSIQQGLLFLSSGRTNEPPLVLDQVSAKGIYDAPAQRLVVQQGNLSGATTGGAFSGSLTFGPKPMLALGIAASRVPASAAKRLWPALVARGTRGWALERVESGVIDRILIALNVPLDAIGRPEVELPDEAVRLEFTASNGSFRPAANLPLIYDAEVSGIVTGRTARVRIAKATLDTAQGRRITLSDGVLEVPNHIPPNPDGTIRFHFDAAADAVAEMAASDLLKGVTGFNVDPASARGSVSANVNLDLIFRQDVRGEEVRYSAEGDVKDFAADAVVHGQRVEGVNARVTVTSDAIQAKGTGRIAGAQASFDLRRHKEKGESEFRVVATLDDAARARMGMDLAPWLVGPVQVQAQGRSNERENRFDVDADLTAAQVADLVPGWQKAAGRPAKASFRVVERDNSIRLEELSVAGGGTTIKGTLELDREGAFVSANLPVFHLSDGDKANLRAERAPDGALRVFVRGDVLDARGAIRGLTSSGESAGSKKDRPRDLDLELRLGAATGHNGEVARQIELKVQRRNGAIRTFSLIGKIGRDASMVGELRARDGGRPVIYLTSGDAGALLRYADFYGKLYGGEAWIVIEPPSPDGKPQEGIINIREFTIRGEPALDRMQAAAPAEQPGSAGANVQRPASQGVPFLRSQVEFNRTPGRFNIREAVIYGPTIGATVDGVLDFAQNHVHLRGTYVPAFGLNNLFGQLPIVGLFLGGPKEGLIAITFEVVGPASGPTLRVNPMSAVAPGFLRKLFEFRGAADTPPASGPFDPN